MRAFSNAMKGYLAGKNTVVLGIIGLVIVGLPLTLVALQKQTDVRQRASSTTVSLSPVADAFVDFADQTRNYGTNTELRTNASTQAKITYMRFDLATLAGKTISSAKLRIYITDGSTDPQTLRNVSTDTWTESGITYQNKPATGTTITTNTGGTVNTWKEIDITTAVAANTGQLFSFAMDQAGTDGFRFGSKEDANKPTLVVTYLATTATATPNPVSPTLNPPTSTPRPVTGTPAPATSTPRPATATPPPPTGVSTVQPTATLPVGGSCPAVATDTILLIDKSSSMQEEISLAKTAAKAYVDQAASNSQNRIGLVTYDTAVTSVTMTNNFAAIKTAIDGIALGSGTCAQCGIDKANSEIATTGRAGVKKVIVMLTDGRANKVNGSSTTNEAAEAAAVQSVKNGVAASQTTFFTIGLGSRVNTTFLQQIATVSGGDYYFSPTASDLTTIYRNIAGIVGKGSVTGTVFTDTNGNGQMDSGETAITGKQITIKTSTGTPVGTDTSSDTGRYVFTGLCNGTSYVVSAAQQTGWTQTAPANNGTYAISVTNGNSFESKDFGFRQAVATSTPQPTATRTPTPSPTRTPTPSPTVSPTQGPAPTVTLTSSKTIVNTTGSLTLTWTSTNAASCTASSQESDEWRGSRTVSGNQLISSFDTPQQYTFTLTCSNTGGQTATDSVTVTAIPHQTPTPPPPGTTTLNFTVFLHSIGTSGDNRNPTGHSLSNKNPLHPIRNAYVEIYNAANQLVATSAGNMQYNDTEGNFKGSVAIDNTFTSGSHIVTVKTDRYLRKLFPGIQSITAGQTNTLPATTLVAGDINGDNKLDILDYTILIGCYTSTSQPTAKNCDDEEAQMMSDLNDDGPVNLYDYNLFLRELSVQAGYSQ